MESSPKKAFAALLFAVFTILTAAAADTEPVRICYSAGTYGLDPAHSYTTTEAQIFTAVYEGLVSYHPLTLEPVPAVSDKWIISPDGKTYLFSLREDAFYWNGDPVTAYDFYNAWFRILSPEEEAEYSFMFDIIKGAKDYRTGKTSERSEVGIRVSAPRVLEIVLEEPSEHFLKILCHHTFSPLHPLSAENGKWKPGPSVIGNGPFYIKSRNSGKTVLEKNKLYWDAERVKPENIEILFLDDPEAAAAMFNNGEIHWAPDGIYFNMAENQDYLVTNPLFATTYFFFNSENDAIKDSRVRRALALILPWDRIRSDQVFFIPADTLVPAIPHYPRPETVNNRDMREALKLLHEAGYTAGSGIGTLVIRITANPDSRYIAETMKQSWEKFLDLKVSVEEFDFGSYYEALNRPGFSLGTTTWIGDYADPLTFLQMWTSDSNLNDSGYADPVYDTLLAKSMTETGKKRYETLSEAESLLLSGGVVLPLANYPAFNLVNTDLLEGWFPNVLDIHPFKYLRKVSPSLPAGLAYAARSY